jgi:uncharacterized protein YjiS (DUF1127 family)
MATLTSRLSDSLHSPTKTGTGARLRSLLLRLNAYRRERRNQALILSQLANADERELRDLGINRYDFQAIAKGEFRR